MSLETVKLAHLTRLLLALLSEYLRSFMMWVFIGGS